MPAPDSPPRRSRVLLAEDDHEMRRLLATALRRDGYDVLEAASGAELVYLLATRVMGAGRTHDIDLVVSDVRMPGCSGLEALAALRRAEATTPMVLITAFGDTATHAEAYRLGAAAIFDKPFDVDDFRTLVLNLTGRL